MQTILSLDLSAEPCELTLSRITENLVEVLARTTVGLGLVTDTKGSTRPFHSSNPSRNLLSHEELASLFPRESDAPEKTEQDSGDNTDIHTDFTPLESEALGQELEDEGATKEAVQKQLAHVITQLREALSSFSDGWSSAAVILPAGEHLSFNLNLPFGDNKNLNRIVDLEVQDLVPFDLEEFFVHYASLGAFRTGNAPAMPHSSPETPPTAQSNGSPYDIHVGLIPRHIVKNALALCKAIGIEPRVLTTPASAVAATYHLARNFFKENSVIIHARGEQYSLAALINGEVRMEQTVLLGNLARDHSQEEDGTRATLAALRLIMAATERRYEASITKMYVLGESINRSVLQQALGRPVEVMEFSDILKPHQSGAGISPLAAIFAKDDDAPPILSNMRMREFSFGPKLGDILRVCKPLLAPLVSVAGAILLGLGVVYGVRQYDINQIESQLLTEVRRVIPDFDPAGGEIIDTLRKSEIKLSEELGVLGSPSKVAPLETFSTVIASVPSDIGVTIQTIKISDKFARVSGSAPDYSAIDKLEAAMKKNFSTIKKTTGNSSTSGTKFDFEIPLN